MMGCYDGYDDVYYGCLDILFLIFLNIFWRTNKGGRHTQQPHNNTKSEADLAFLCTVGAGIAVKPHCLRRQSLGPESSPCKVGLSKLNVMPPMLVWTIVDLTFLLLGSRLCVMFVFCCCFVFGLLLGVCVCVCVCVRFFFCPCLFCLLLGVQHCSIPIHPTPSPFPPFFHTVKITETNMFDPLCDEISFSFFWGYTSWWAPHKW